MSSNEALSPEDQRRLAAEGRRLAELLLALPAEPVTFARIGPPCVAQMAWPAQAVLTEPFHEPATIRVEQPEAVNWTFSINNRAARRAAPARARRRPRLP
jgi:hypothetical protein